MADLNARTELDPSLHTWPTHDGACPPEHRGPPTVDAETVQAVAAQIEAGILQFPPHTSNAVANVTDEALDEMFAGYLASSPLSARTALPHRTYALGRAFRDIASAVESGVHEGAPLAVSHHQVGVMIVNVEGYLAGMHAEFEQYAPASFPRELIATAVEHTAVLIPELVEKLTGLRLQQLAAMRSSGVGPAFIKVPRTRSSIRYPLVGLLAWLYGGASR